MIIDKISTNDKKKILEYIKRFGTSSKNDGRIYGGFEKLNKVLDHWRVGKSGALERLFGDNLILEKEIEFNDIGSEETEKLFSDFTKKHEKFYAELDELLGAAYRQADERESSIFIKHLDRASTTLESLIRNSISNKNLTYVYRVNGKKATFSSSSKIFRAIDKVAKMNGAKFSEGLFESWRDDISMLISKVKTKGTLCLSIHPLDFMTMSDNANNWSSCMSWKNSGCYRGGTLETMNSDHCIVAYLKSSQNMDLYESEKWNSKAWRMLIIVTDDVIASGKNYPYTNMSLQREAMKWVAELYNERLNGRFAEPTERSSSMTEINIDEERCVFVEFETYYAMYNDYENSYFNITFYFSKRVKDGEMLALNYSDESFCLDCGRSLVDEEEHHLMCSNCDYEIRCECCDAVISHTEDPKSYNFDEIEGVFCSECYKEVTRTDCVTGEAFPYYRGTHIEVIVNAETPLGERKFFDTWSETIKGSESFRGYMEYRIFTPLAYVSERVGVKEIAKMFTKSGEIAKENINSDNRAVRIPFSDVSDNGFKLIGITKETAAKMPEIDSYIKPTEKLYKKAMKEAGLVD